MTQTIRKGHVILNDQADLAKNQIKFFEVKVIIVKTSLLYLADLTAN